MKINVGRLKSALSLISKDDDKFVARGARARDPHLIERGMFTEVEHPKAGTIKVTNFPVKFSETPGEIQTATPLLGQHNEEILSKILGYTEEQIQNLEKAGVISSDRSN